MKGKGTADELCSPFVGPDDENQNGSDVLVLLHPSNAKNKRREVGGWVGWCGGGGLSDPRWNLRGCGPSRGR